MKLLAVLLVLALAHQALARPDNRNSGGFQEDEWDRQNWIDNDEPHEFTQQDLDALLEACSKIDEVEDLFTLVICEIYSQEEVWDRKKRAIRNVRSLQRKSLKKRQSDDVELTAEELKASLEACSEIAHLEPTTLDEVFAQLVCAIISEDGGWVRKKRAVRKIRGAQKNLKQLKHKK